MRNLISVAKLIPKENIKKHPEYKEKELIAMAERIGRDLYEQGEMDISEDDMTSLFFGDESVRIIMSLKVPSYSEIVIPTAKWEKCDYKTFEHGFIETHYGKGICCTNCRYGFKSDELKMRNFCPSCGAKMDKEGVNNDSKAEM